jgi:hypothetical protein
MISHRSAISFLEIAIVMLAGFSVSYVMTKNDFQFFALPHITFLVLAVIIRTSAGKWKLSDWGIVPGVGKQIRTGLILWIVVQVYYALGHIFIPLLPVAAQMGAQTYGITTLDALSEKLLSIALFKAGILETFRYFGYAEGLLMQSFGAPLGAVMTLVYFGSAHMGIMNLVVLPVSFLFVYFYRTYKVVVPLIVFHVLGDAGAFIQMYLSYQKMYFYNYAIFIIFITLIFTFRKNIKETLRPIKHVILTDFYWLRSHIVKVVLLSLVLPVWLYVLLYLDKHI